MTGRIVALMCVCAGLLDAGCRSSTDSAQGIAERFIDEHYVRMNLRAAREYTVGLAQRKVDEETRLVGDHVIDASTRQPRVTYRLKEQPREDANGVSFLFEGTVSVDGADAFTRQWLVTTRREADGTWKVSNFSEFEEPQT